MRLLVTTSSIICLLLLNSCAEDTDTLSTAESDQTILQICLSHIEYEVYTGDRKQAQIYTLLLNNMLTKQKTNSTKSQQKKLVKLCAKTAEYYKSIATCTDENALDKLRILKALTSSLSPDQDTTYLHKLWAYEQEMYYTTKAAMDPMLDLYDWPEFADMVTCLNEKWTQLKQDHPTQDFMLQDRTNNPLRTTANLNLQTAMEKFNAEVTNDDNGKNTLCETAEVVRSAYFEYLKMAIADFDIIYAPPLEY